MVLRTAQLRDSQGHSSRGERAIVLTIEVVRRNRDGKENALRNYSECGGMRDGPDYAVIQAAMEIAAQIRRDFPLWRTRRCPIQGNSEGR